MWKKGKKQVRRPLALLQAFDEAKFGSQRTLNLRASQPTEIEAVRRTDAWVREQQVSNAGEVLIITGRGLGSPGGVSVVREGVHRLLLSLRRRGVVASVREHTPGSFVVQLAPMSALLEAPRRKRETPVRPARPEALRALSPETYQLLRTLSILSLGALGVSDASHYIEEEMLRHFAALTSGAANPEGQLSRALQRALDEYVER